MLSIEKNLSANFDVDPQQCCSPLCPNEVPVAGGMATSYCSKVATLQELVAL